MNYETALDEAILAEVDADDLGDLATRLGDVFPTDLRDRVVHLHRDGRLPDLRLAKAVRKWPPNQLIDDGLPVPHPIDGDWRLDAASRDRMEARILERSLDAEKLLLGVPTVFQRLLDPTLRVTLVDANPLLPRALASKAVMTSDITLAQPVLNGVSCVFADPPWYPDKINHFLWYASACMAINGMLYFSLPGVLTRPSVFDERLALFEFASQCGLEYVRLERHALRYESPPFEQATLAAAGLPAFAPAWRGGDLATFRKTDDRLAPRPSRLPEIIWRRQPIDDIDIRFRVRTPDAFDPTPRTLASSSVRLGVTSRDPLLASVDVWTSGNQIFATSNPCLLADLAEFVNTKAACHEMIERRVGRTLSAHEREDVRVAIAALGRLTSTDATRGRTQRPKGPSDGSFVA